MCVYKVYASGRGRNWATIEKLSTRDEIGLGSLILSPFSPGRIILVPGVQLPPEHLLSHGKMTHPGHI